MMDRRRRRQILGFAAALAWTAALAASFGRVQLSAKASVAVQLGTTPAEVRLTIDGEPHDGGRYLTTPAKIMIRPGTVRMRIQRDGYVAYDVSIQARPGETRRVENVVLERVASQPFAAVEVVYPQSERAGSPLNVEINDGLLRGETPLFSSDLRAGVDHVLTVYPRWPEKDPRFRCRFKSEAEEGAEVKIKLSTTKNGSVRAQGCERLKDKPPQDPKRRR